MKTTQTIRKDFYFPSNPQSPAQTTQRDKMAPGWAWYFAKTDEQKKEDQRKGDKVGLTGPMFSMRQYLNSH